MNHTLATKGRVCHLCGLPGANSADHEPTRSELIAARVPNPDAPMYLWPAHKVCNLRRGTRPITAELRAELRQRMQAEPLPEPGVRAGRFGAFFEATGTTGRSGPFPLFTGTPVKTDHNETEVGR